MKGTHISKRASRRKSWMWDVAQKRASGYYKRFPMAAPGVNFTTEQLRMIDQLVKAGEMVKAQQSILDQLKKEFPSAE